MKIISINTGSSSLKFSLFDMSDESVIASGVFERIGIEGSCYTIKYNDEKIEQEIVLENHADAVNVLLDKLIALNIIKSLDDIDGVGHRIVSGGDRYSESVLVNDKVISDIEELKEFAPLHNPAHVLGLKAFKQMLPNVKMAVVFDTAFHQTMSEEEYLYAVPYNWYSDYKIRKYGAHGTSHRFVSLTMAEKLGRKDLRIINCHIGNGSSITAIKDGKCVDTSMGFTPLAGVIMGTRSGDIDPSIIPYAMAKEGKNASEIIDDLNKKSGLLGISGVSSDFRDVEKGIADGNKRCELARRKLVRTIVNYISQYYVLLGGCDVLTFTAGIGENSITVRSMVVEKLAALGFKLDIEANNSRGEFVKISSKDSSALIYVVPTDEELMIARDTLNLISR